MGDNSKVEKHGVASYDSFSNTFYRLYLLL